MKTKIAAIGVSTTAAFPKLPGKPLPVDLTGYATIATAKTVPAPGADGANSGATGYLGLTVEPDRAGRPIVDLVQLGSPAQAAGMTEGWISDAAAAGDLRHRRTSSGVYLFERRDVLAYAQGRK